MRPRLTFYLVSIASLAVGASLGFYYQDSFFYKRSLSLATRKKGVVFHDKLRATPGYHIVDYYLHSRYCEVIDERGPWNQLVLPGSFCTILEDGSYIAVASGHKLTFFDPHGNVMWWRKVHVHHDVWVDSANKKIFLISGDVEKAPGDKYETRRDAIRAFDFSGDLIFEWRFKTRQADFDAKINKKSERYYISGIYQWTHFNSVQPLPPNPLAKLNPAFREGNILSYCVKNNALFIIDQDSREIVWVYRPREWEEAHGVRMNKSGMISLLANKQLKEEGGKMEVEMYSTIRIFNPLNPEETLKTIALNPRSDFFTELWGSLQELPNGHFMVTNSAKGSAFEVDSAGRILWEYISPKNKENEPYPIYRVKWISYDFIDKKLGDWLKFF